jgi:hypothetical protein
LLAVATCAACSSPTSPEPAGGGTPFLLSFEQFQSTVQPRLHARGCSAGGDCHGGGIRGTFQLSPASTPDAGFDFEQARLQVWGATPTRSPLLRKPLAESSGGLPHAEEAFASAEDADYQRILEWILAGEFQKSTPLGLERGSR